MGAKNISQLTAEQKDLLLSKSPFVLPDNPSDKHFSPAQIKRKMYEGLLVLFDYMNNLIASINENTDLSNTDLNTLFSYFTDGMAKFALKDADGDNIDISSLRQRIMNGMADQETRAYVASRSGNVYTDAGIEITGATAKAWTIPTRRENGELVVGNPTANNHSATKYYVDQFGKSIDVTNTPTATQFQIRTKLKDANGNEISEKLMVYGSASSSYAGLLTASDKVKIDNIATDIATALASAKSYTDDKVARTNLVSVLGEASQSLNGLMSASDKAHLDALYAVLGAESDADTFVNTINEILAVFDQYPEGTTIVNALAGKVDVADIQNNLTSDETAKPLSAYQGKVLKALADALDASKANASDVYTKAGAESMVDTKIAGVNTMNVIADQDNSKNYTFQIKVQSGKAHLIATEVE